MENAPDIHLDYIHEILDGKINNPVLSSANQFEKDNSWDLLSSEVNIKKVVLCGTF